MKPDTKSFSFARERVEPRAQRIPEVDSGVAGHAYAVVVPHDASVPGAGGICPVQSQSPATVRYSYKGVRVNREDLAMLLLLEAIEAAARIRAELIEGMGGQIPALPTSGAV